MEIPILIAIKVRTTCIVKSRWHILELYSRQLNTIYISYSFLKFRQNTELAKLHQDYNKLSKELTEKMEVLQEVEEQKKALEMKTLAHEEQIHLLQVSQ